MLRRYATGWKPLHQTWGGPAPCGRDGDCTWQEHPPGYLDRPDHVFNCDLGIYYASVCPRGVRRPAPYNVQYMHVTEWGDGQVTVTLDDGNTLVQWRRRGTAPGTFEAVARWLEALAFYDLAAIESRLKTWRRDDD